MFIDRFVVGILATICGLFAPLVAGCQQSNDAGIVSIHDQIAMAGESSTDPSPHRATAESEARRLAENEKARTENNTPDRQPMLEHPFPRHLPAPGLEGGVEWINAAGPIDLKDLRGKFVLLDFWTYCCINCMHVLPELKKLEQKYPHNLVVIGVHSAKFDTEEDSNSIRQAVMRYEIEHPVVNDANHKIWQRYFCDSWPSMRIIDPEGNLVAMNGGEVRFEVLDEFMKQALPYYRQRKLLDERPVHFDLEHRKSTQTPLRFPGKILADEKADRLFIADSNHNRIVVASLDGKLQHLIGSGEIGTTDGDFKTAQFNHPQGLALHGETLYVADTENHLLRKIDLKSQHVTTISGTGAQAQESWGGISFNNLQRKLPERFINTPKKTALNSPWAIWIHGKDLYIAMAGPHQIWKMVLDESEIGPYAGNGREDIVDGPLLPSQPYETGYSSFAQPSGLTSDGTWLYVADSEGSSIRAVPFDPKGKVRTVVGTSHLDSARLFTFGDVDGPEKSAQLQHCLDVVYHAGKLYVADTYNHKIKVIDLNAKTCKTIAGTRKAGLTNADAGTQATFFEPTGLAFANDKLYVADTNNHVIRTIDLAHNNAVATLPIAGLNAPEPPPAKTNAPDKPNFADARQIMIDPVQLKPDANGKIFLNVKIKLPSGYKINPLAPMRYFLETENKTGPVDRGTVDKLIALEKPTAEFDVPLSVKLPSSDVKATDTAKLSFRYYYCQEGAEGLCKIGSVTFHVPMQFSSAAETSTVYLPLTVD